MKQSVHNTVKTWTVRILLIFSPALCQGQTAPVIGLHENTPDIVALTNVRIVVSPGTVLEKATLIVRDGIVEAAGPTAAVPPDAVVRDCAGKTVYPGFIDLYSHYGIPGTVTDAPGTLHWNDRVRPERHAALLFSPDKTAAQNLRKNGFTAVLTFPSAGIFKGDGALVLLSDTVSNKAVLRENEAQAMALFAPGNDYPNSLQGSIALIRQTFLDARWYRDAWEVYSKDTGGRTAPETNLSLEALRPFADGSKPVVIETSDVLDIFDCTDISREFGLDLWLRGSGFEYRRLEAVKSRAGKLIVPLNFSEPPDVSTDETSLRELRHWDFAPENPARLSQAGIDFALTADTVKHENFLKNLRTAVKRGLPPEKALGALTTTPARWLTLSDVLGTIEKGKIANFIVTDGDLFDDKTKILETWVNGERYEVNPEPEIDVRGTWTVQVTPEDRIQGLKLEISGEASKPEAKVHSGEKTVPSLKTVLEKRIIMLAFPGDSLGCPGIMRMTGMAEKGAIYGDGVWGDGAGFTWHAELTEPWKAKPDTTHAEPPVMAEYPVVFPEGAFGWTMLPEQPETVLIKNAVVWTCGPKGVLKEADVLVKKGKIAEVGRNLSAPRGAVIIDGAGKHVTPGLIDAHS
ncbi:amidohydrolase family protein, partial [bacterium]|nr:amidohydrolase family protein [bacterium]